MTRTLAQAREDIATVLSGVGAFSVRPRPIKSPRLNDGWVVISRLTPGDFSTCLATLTAVLILGSDEVKAEEMFESVGVQAVDALTKSDLNCTDVSLEAQILVVDGAGSSLYALAITLTMEVF